MKEVGSAAALARDRVKRNSAGRSEGGTMRAPTKLCLAVIVTLFGVLPLRPVLAMPTQRFVAEYQAMYALNVAATNNSGLQFTLDGSTVIGGLNQIDVNVSVLRGSGLVSSQPPQLLPVNGDMLVTIVGDVRSVFPTSQNKTAKVRIEILRKGVNTLKVKGSDWINVAPDNSITPLGPAPLVGGGFALDPTYVAFNDGLTPVGIRNLQFLSNISESAFDALDVGVIAAAPFDSNLPNFSLSPGTSSRDLGLTFGLSPEPDPGNFLVALGQVVDSQGGMLSTFIQGVQAVPGPSTLTLLAGGVGGIVGIAWRRCALRR